MEQNIKSYNGEEITNAEVGLCILGVLLSSNDNKTL